jgi:hypothetical protein
MTTSLMATGFAALVALLGAGLLAYAIVRTLRVVRGSVLVRLPAVAQQDVDFAEPGRVVLCIEQPRLETALWRAKYALHDASGREVPSALILFRTSVSGISSVRLSLRSFDLAQPGRYRLTVTGIAPGHDTSRCAVVFTRPHALQLVACILGIVLGGVALIGGIVFSALGLTGR